MPALIIQVIIVLLVCGFLMWAARRLLALIPMEPIIRQVIDVLLIILVVALILFYIVIPVLHQLAGLSISVVR